MSEVKRYDVHGTCGGNCHEIEEAVDGDWVNSVDFDAEHALRIEAERQIKVLLERCADLRYDFHVMQQERDSLGRQASAFEEAMGHHQAKAGRLELQVGELREQLAERQAKLERVSATGCRVVVERESLQTKLDTAMGFLCEAQDYTNDVSHNVHLWLRIDTFINTTSTEGK